MPVKHTYLYSRGANEWLCRRERERKESEPVSGRLLICLNFSGRVLYSILESVGVTFLLVSVLRLGSDSNLYR